MVNCVKEKYASKTHYLLTKRIECDIPRNYKSSVGAIHNQCNPYKPYNVHPLKIGHSEKEVYHGTKLPGRVPISDPSSELYRYQLLHRDTSRSGAIHIKRLQVLKLNEKSSNIKQSAVSCTDSNFENFPCKK
jgi:hypothetical protein